MGTKARGRGVAATFGLLLVLAGIAGAVVLWVMAERRPEQAVDGFARGPVGCTTTLEFSDTGTFYVFEERVGDGVDAFAECEPVPSPDAAFGAELVRDGRPVALRDDTSITYDTADAVGTSIARVEVDEPGRYDLIVVGADPGVVAAVGRDPDAGVDDLRRGAVVVGVLGVLLGVLLLLLAGRRSKRAATYGVPEGPGWGPQSVSPAAAWPPEPPRLQQQPVNPLLPPDATAPAGSTGLRVPDPAATPTPGPTDASTDVSTDVPTDVSTDASTDVPTDVSTDVSTDASADVSTPTGGASPGPWAPPQPGERADPPPPA